MKHYLELEQLLKAGAHFGHLTRRWNPAMEDFIFNERNGIHIIDLRKTQILLTLARDAAYDIAKSGRNILFVGTKMQAKDTIEKEAKNAGVNYVSERWLGGMLTNFSTIRKSINRLGAIDKMSVDGTYEKVTKKERLLLEREKERLRRMFGGIESMTRIPGALFIVDIKKEHLAVKEAKKLGIPVIGIVDTNSDPYEINYPIPANDDSRNTVELISKVIAEAVEEGSQIAKTKMEELAAQSEKISKEQKEVQEEEPKVKRKLRERKKTKPGSKKAKEAKEKAEEIKEQVKEEKEGKEGKEEKSEKKESEKPKEKAEKETKKADSGEDKKEAKAEAKEDSSDEKEKETKE